MRKHRVKPIRHKFLFLFLIILSQTVVRNESYNTTNSSQTTTSRPNSLPERFGWIWIPFAVILVIVGLVAILAFLCYPFKDKKIKEEKIDSKVSSTSSDDKFSLTDKTEHRGYYDKDYNFTGDSSVKSAESENDETLSLLSQDLKQSSGVKSQVSNH